MSAPLVVVDADVLGRGRTGDETYVLNLLRELAEPAPNCRTRFVAFYSDIDHVVWPSRNARLDHPDLQVRNVPVPGVGHLSMPNNGQVAFKISSALAELDPFETRRTAVRLSLGRAKND